MKLGEGNAHLQIALHQTMISAVLFDSLSILCVGFLLVYQVKRTDSLKPSIVTDILNNLLAVLS